MQTVLFIRFSSIGDIVLCSPLFRALKTQQPDTRIFFATKKQYKSLLEHNPYIDKLFLLDKDMEHLISALQAEQIDFVADLHNNLRSRRVRWAVKAHAKVVSKYNWQKWLLVRFKINKMPNSHIVDRYFETLKPLGVQNDKQGLEFYNGLSLEDSQHLLQSIPQQYAVVVVGGTYFTKRMPIPKLIEAVEALPYPVVLIGGKGDISTAAVVCQVTQHFQTINMCGQMSIAQSAELIRLSQLVITGDTGMMHIAAAYHKTILSVWGNTVPALGFAPYMPQQLHKAVILENNALKCRPCSKLGYNKCPKKHFKCMKDLDINAAVKNMVMRPKTKEKEF